MQTHTQDKMMREIPFQNSAVAAIFENYPETMQNRLLALRRMIFEVAAATEGVGEVEETLKWGQPSYLTPVTKSGTPIRIDTTNAHPDEYGMFVHCQTSLVDTYRSLYTGLLEFEGDRCVRFDVTDEIPVDAVKHCIALALSYHQKKRRQ